MISISRNVRRPKKEATYKRYLKIYLDRVVEKLKYKELEAKYGMSERAIREAIAYFKEQNDATVTLHEKIASINLNIRELRKLLRRLRRQFCESTETTRIGETGESTTIRVVKKRKVFRPETEAMIISKISEQEKLLAELQGVLKNPTQEMADSIETLAQAVTGRVRD